MFNKYYFYNIVFLFNYLFIYDYVRMYTRFEVEMIQNSGFWVKSLLIVNQL